jgi:hypothetical protein
MRIYEQMDIKLTGIYERLKKDKEDLTGWSSLQEIKKESNLDEALTNFLTVRLFEIAWNKREIINLPKMMEFLLSSPYKKEKVSIEREGNLKEYKEVYRGVYLKRGIITKLFEKLNLTKTLDFFIKIIILEDKEINPKHYVGDKLIKSYLEDKDKVLNNFLKIFEEEYNKKKIVKKGKIIKF